MKCPNCGVENREGASFCRACGAKLAPQATNIMDKFPDYDFVPTNLIDWKKPWLAKIRSFFFLIILPLAVLFSFYSLIVIINPTEKFYNEVFENYYNKQGELYYCFEVSDPLLNIFDTKRACKREVFTAADSDTIDCTIEVFRIETVLPYLILGVVLSMLSILAIKYGKRQYPAKDNLLKNSADYIQKYRYTGLIRGRKKPVLKFFIKDNKMGLMDVAHYCVFLTAQYDVLEWREKNKYLNATTGNRTFIIDINGNELK